MSPSITACPNVYVLNQRQEGLPDWLRSIHTPSEIEGLQRECFQDWAFCGLNSLVVSVQLDRLVNRWHQFAQLFLEPFFLLPSHYQLGFGIAEWADEWVDLFNRTTDIDTSPLKIYRKVKHC